MATVPRSRRSADSSPLPPCITTSIWQSSALLAVGHELRAAIRQADGIMAFQFDGEAAADATRFLEGTLVGNIRETFNQLTYLRDVVKGKRPAPQDEVAR